MASIGPKWRISTALLFWQGRPHFLISLANTKLETGKAFIENGTDGFRVLKIFTVPLLQKTLNWWVF